jgi:hypothetical protein
MAHESDPSQHDNAIVQQKVVRARNGVVSKVQLEGCLHIIEPNVVVP